MSENDPEFVRLRKQLCSLLSELKRLLAERRVALGTDAKWRTERLADLDARSVVIAEESIGVMHEIIGLTDSETTREDLRTAITQMRQSQDEILLRQMESSGQPIN